MGMKYVKANNFQLKGAAADYSPVTTQYFPYYEDLSFLNAYGTLGNPSVKHVAGTFSVSDGIIYPELNDLGKSLLTLYGNKCDFYISNRYGQYTWSEACGIQIKTMLETYGHYCYNCLPNNGGSPAVIDISWATDYGQEGSYYGAINGGLVLTASGGTIVLPFYGPNTALRTIGMQFTQYNGQDTILTFDASTSYNTSCAHNIADPEIIEVIDSDPEPNIDPSDTGGGGGDGYPDSGHSEEPDLPTLSALGSGLVQLYNPTVSQLRALGVWLWNNDGLDLTDLKRLWSDPMDVILGLSIFPAQPEVESNDSYIQFGNLTSTVQAKKVTNQYLKYSLGKVFVKRALNSYLDYAPYTRIQLYLPYIGIKAIDTDDVMNKWVKIKYSIDFLSGACVAHVMTCKTENGTYDTMYEFGSSINSMVPIVARDYTSLIQSVANLAVMGIAGLWSAGGAARAAETAGGAVKAFGAGAASTIAAGVAASARNAASMKPTVEHGSGITGTTGLMASQEAFFIINRPNLCKPDKQEHFTGYPGFIYRVCKTLRGYTKFVNIEINNILATDAELEEIEDWLVNRGVRLPDAARA